MKPSSPTTVAGIHADMARQFAAIYVKISAGDPAHFPLERADEFGQILATRAMAEFGPDLNPDEAFVEKHLIATLIEMRLCAPEPRDGRD